MGSCGLRIEDSDTKEDLGCLTSNNNYLSPLSCSTGDIYYLLVQNITDTSGFTLSFSGDATFISSLEEFESLPVARAFTIQNFDKDYCDYSLLSKVKISKVKVIEVFPNPTNEILTWRLNTTTRITNISIIDLQGKVVTSKIEPTSSSVNVSPLSSGTYILRIQSEDGYGYKMWVKM